MDVLVGVLLWAGAVLGVLTIVVAVVQPARRRASLVVAAVLFLPIGILGILSVGVVFLVAAAICLGFALSADPSAGSGSHT